MPLLMSRDHSTFLIHVPAILRSRMMIEEAHQGTVSHQRHNAVCLINGEFQSADPAQHNDESAAQQAHSNALEFCRPFVNTPYHGVRRGVCANDSADLDRHNSSPLIADRLRRRKAFWLNDPSMAKTACEQATANHVPLGPGTEKHMTYQ